MLPSEIFLLGFFLLLNDNLLCIGSLSSSSSRVIINDIAHGLFLSTPSLKQPFLLFLFLLGLLLHHNIHAIGLSLRERSGLGGRSSGFALSLLPKLPLLLLDFEKTESLLFLGLDLSKLLL